MTDPFGNYLCQKLLEHSNDSQRTVLVDNAAPEMVKIALNQHGTRALQKMIEYISTPGQTQTIIHALKDKVVELIQDLNGNHVIQKCLNRLSTDDAQFIFDAVGANCVVVGTHRHGCCVLQRCIDHASSAQKAALVGSITQNAFALVQDPFGNYVLQYIVDLNEPSFTNPLCYAFQGSIPALSKQKFSSNVIEKCLRHADAHASSMMVEEMLNSNELEKMLRDSYANYVVQTALDFVDPGMRAKLVDVIRPILPSIRGTPYGRRIQTKILSQGGDAAAEVAPATNRANGPAFTNRPQAYHGTALNGFQPNGVEHKAFVSPNPPNGPPSMSNGLNNSFVNPYGGPPAAPPPPPQYSRMPPNNNFGGFF
jgi:Pumilio-family RNA binding repeat